jgi:hypothetical protein
MEVGSTRSINNKQINENDKLKSKEAQKTKVSLLEKERQKSRKSG